MVCVVEVVCGEGGRDGSPPPQQQQENHTKEKAKGNVHVIWSKMLPALSHSFGLWVGGCGVLGPFRVSASQWNNLRVEFGATAFNRPAQHVFGALHERSTIRSRRPSLKISIMQILCRGGTRLPLGGAYVYGLFALRLQPPPPWLSIAFFLGGRSDDVLHVLHQMIQIRRREMVWWCALSQSTGRPLSPKTS